MGVEVTRREDDEEGVRVFVTLKCGDYELL